MGLRPYSQKFFYMAYEWAK